MYSAFYIFPRRPRFQPLPGGSAHLPQVLQIGKSRCENAPKRVHVAARVHKTGLLVNNQVARRTHAVARHYSAAAQHSLVHYDAERIIARRQDHQIRGRVNGWQLRLIGKAQKAHATGNTELGRFELKAGAERTVAREHKNRVLQPWARKSLQQVVWPLPWLQLGTKKNDNIAPRSAPGHTD